MATETTAVEAAREAESAAEAARQAAEQAEAFADTAAAAVAAGTETVTGVAGLSPIVFQISIFVLAVFVGYYVVWSVTPALHTPLMSVTNAISSVIVVGALLAVAVEIAPAAGENAHWARWLGFAALTMASVNIFGGFLVTQRMLGMYKKKTK